MADNTKIEWTDATWNPITGCSVVSPGCTNCYAMKLAGTRLRHHPSRAGLTQNSKAGPVWTGDVRLNREWFRLPFTWKKPRRIFVCAHGDLFHEDVPDEWIDQVFAVMALCPQHVFQVLTKRAARMHDYLSKGSYLLFERWLDAVPRGKWPISKREAIATLNPYASDEIRHLYNANKPQYPLVNVWLGVSVEDQQRADERIPLLLNTPAAIRWISAEPLLGPIFLKEIHKGDEIIMPLRGLTWYPTPPDWKNQGITARGSPKLDWVVVGGESGKGARPMHPDWARALRDQCSNCDTPYVTKFFMKQMGTSGECKDIPADLMVREYLHG